MAHFDLIRLWQWWTRELSGLLPGRDARRVLSAQASVELHVDPDGVRAIRKPRFMRPLSESPRFPSLHEALQQVRRGDRVVLSVDPSFCLLRNKTIPAASLPEADRILALDMERNTPFETKNVITGWFASGPREKTGLQAVKQFILRRDIIDEGLDDIAARGASPIAVAVRGEEGAAWPPVCGLDGRPFAEAKERRWATYFGWSVLSAALFMAFAGYAALNRQEQDLMRLDAEIEQLQAPTQQVRAMLDARTSATAQRDELFRRRQAQVPSLRVWEELSLLMPDTAWIQALSSGPDFVQIEGYAKAAEGLIPLLEGSNMFRDVKFTSPVSRTAAGDFVQFSVRMGLEAGQP